MRIQILPLPPVMLDGDVEEPFALVLDQCPVEDASDEAVAHLYEFAQQCGAMTALVTPETVEIVDSHAEPVKPQVHVGEIRVQVPEDFDPEKVKRHLRFALGRCVECGNRPYRCVCPVPAPGEPAEIASLPVEVRQLIHAVDSMRDQCAEADEDRRGALWRAVHEANDKVWWR